MAIQRVLPVQRLRGGWQNTASGNDAAVGGGVFNDASGLRSAIPGGQYNVADGSYSLAAGRKAKANHDGAFVWADATDADFASTQTNQFAVRASGGMHLASDAGDAKAVSVGDHFSDNGIIAWGRIAANGTLDDDFGIVSPINHVQVGVYELTMTAQVGQWTALIPIAIAEIDGAPTSTSAMRIVSIDHGNGAVSNDTTMFRVYINRGSGPLVDSDFVFMVTGR